MTERVSFDIGWAVAIGEREWASVGICGACSMPICFIAIEQYSVGAGGPHRVNGLIEPGFIVDQTWPTVSEVAAPLYTPDHVRCRYVEGEEAFKRKSWNAAVAMYRSALDLATKGLPDVPNGLTFYNRLKWLHEHHRITPDMRAWADHVRVEGNDALHDPEEFEVEDARPLRLFTEMFLKYIFELPGEVQRFRGGDNDGATD